MSKNKLLIYISISISLIAIILSIGFRVLRANDDINHATKINLTTLDPNLYDQSWLTESPCTAPCWYGLKPGETSRENAKTLASGIPFIDNSKVKESSTGMSFSCKVQDDNRGGCVVMIFADNILESIYIIPNYPITMEQAVEKLGDPNGFSVNLMNPNNDRLHIIWSKKQLVLEHTKPNTMILFMNIAESLHTQIIRGDGKIPKDLLIEMVIYTTPYHIELDMRDHDTWKGFVGE